MIRQVFVTRKWGDRVVAGHVRKYVGETARTMGSDPAYVAYPLSPLDNASVHSTWTQARERLITLYRSMEAGR